MSDVNGVEEHESIDSYPKVRRRFGVEEHSLLFAKPDTVTSETRTRLYMHTLSVNTTTTTTTTTITIIN